MYRDIIITTSGGLNFTQTEQNIVQDDVQGYRIVYKLSSEIDGFIKVTAKLDSPIFGTAPISGDTAYYVIPNSMYAVEGDVPLRVSIVTADERVITTKEITLKVIEANGEADLAGDDRVPALDTLIAEVIDLKNQVTVVLENLTEVEGEIQQHLINTSNPHATSYQNLTGTNPSYTKAEANALLDGKVDKVTGKGLSTNDFTDALETKLTDLPDNVALTDWFGEKVTFLGTKSITDLDSVTTDGIYSLKLLGGIFNSYAIMSVHTEPDIYTYQTFYLIDGGGSPLPGTIYYRFKDLSAGTWSNMIFYKQLSTEDFTTAEKTKLAGIEENANNYVLPSDVVQDSGYVHTDNNFTDALKTKLTDLPTNTELEADLSNKKDKDEVTLTNIITNGSFETTPIGWNPVRATLELDDTEKKFGSKSLKITATENGKDASINRTFPAVAGHYYYFSFWCKKGTAVKRFLNIYIGATAFDGWGLKETITDTDWVYKSYLFRASESGTATIREYSSNSDDVSGATRYYDGFMLFDLTQAFGENFEPGISTLDSYFSSHFIDTDGVKLPRNLFYQNNSILKNNKIVIFGDSIVGNYYYPKLVGLSTGATVYKCGFGGCLMTYHPVPNYDAFSMSTLADSVVSGDWSLQNTAAANLNNTNVTNNLNTLKSVDFHTVSSIVIAYGTNDFGSEIPIGTDADTTDSTFKGAINYVVDKILTKYPTIQIHFISPIFRADASASGNSDVGTNGAGKKLYDYVTAMKEICAKHKLPFLDLYVKSGINLYNCGINMYYNNGFLGNDGVHPNARGIDLLAQKVTKFLLSV